MLVILLTEKVGLKDLVSEGSGLCLADGSCPSGGPERRGQRAGAQHQGGHDEDEEGGS